ncbi:hypothetical protein [Mycoplasmopsis cricetuli]|uniref:hypothetical protein n=1 Tax=Mycoplasmopsis cricetuli TaxID=171283 RepID=UPI0012EBD146|nr:hypothetical protein [Mycoplasmopsis cricetuli]
MKKIQDNNDFNDLFLEVEKIFSECKSYSFYVSSDECIIKKYINNDCDNDCEQKNKFLIKLDKNFIPHGLGIKQFKKFNNLNSIEILEKLKTKEIKFKHFRKFKSKELKQYNDFQLKIFTWKNIIEEFKKNSLNKVNYYFDYLYSLDKDNKFCKELNFTLLKIINNDKWISLCLRIKNYENELKNWRLNSKKCTLKIILFSVMSWPLKGNQFK